MSDKVVKRNPEDALRDWVRGDTEVDGSYRDLFAADVKAVLERFDLRTQDFKDLVMAILDEPNGIDHLNHLMARALGYRRDRAHRR